MKNFQEILELKRENYREYIDKKIETFERCKSFCPTGALTKMNKTKNFFWGKNNQIITGYASLIITDNEIFEYLFDNVKDFFKQEPVDEKDFKKKLFRCVQKTVFDYLGAGKPSEVKRINTYRGVLDADFERNPEIDFEMDGKISIRSFKGESCGACLERAVIAHECFKMLGFESVLATEQVYNTGIRDLHAFNFVKLDDKAYLYDLINTYFDERQPMPSVVSCEVTDSKMVEQIFDDRTECKVFEYEKETKSQTGRKYTITYGLPEVEQSLS